MTMQCSSHDCWLATWERKNETRTDALETATANDGLMPARAKTKAQLRRRWPLSATVTAMASIIILASCAPILIAPDPDTQDTLPPLTWPEGTHYQIDPTRSEFRVQLSAEGPLARFGHPHVIGTRAINGQVVVPEDWQKTVFQIAFAVDDLLVDPPLWREQAGLVPEIPQKDIDATRQNMQSVSQLHADAFPTIQLQSHSVGGTQYEPQITVWVSLAGHISQQTLPALVHWGMNSKEGSTHTPSDELIVSAATTWRLSELGIEPFSVFGGGLRVGDEIELRVRLYAVSGNDQSMVD